MPTILLTIGPVHTLLGPIEDPEEVDAVIYATPARATIGSVDDAASILEESVDGTTWTPIILNSQNQFSLSGRFIRASVSDAVVVLKAGAALSSIVPIEP